MIRSLRNLLYMVLSLCWLGAATVSAQETGAAKDNAGVGRDRPGIAWTQLSVEQKQLLGPMEAQWSQLPPGRQVALANGAKRFLGMNNNQRKQANRRFEEWNGMSDAERAVIAQRFTEFRGMSAQDKARIRQNAQRFDRMTPEQRQMLRQRFQNLSPAERARARERLRTQPRPRRQ